MERGRAEPVGLEASGARAALRGELFAHRLDDFGKVGRRGIVHERAAVAVGKTQVGRDGKILTREDPQHRVALSSVGEHHEGRSAVSRLGVGIRPCGEEFVDDEGIRLQRRVVKRGEPFAVRREDARPGLEKEPHDGKRRSLRGKHQGRFALVVPGVDLVRALRPGEKRLHHAGLTAPYGFK